MTSSVDVLQQGRPRPADGYKTAQQSLTIKLQQLLDLCDAGEVQAGCRYVVTDYPSAYLVGSTAMTVSGHVGAFDATDIPASLSAFEPGSTVWINGTGLQAVDDSGALASMGGGTVTPVLVYPAAQTADYTAVATDTTIEVDTTSNPVMITLPSTLAKGKQVNVIWVAGTNAATVAGSGLPVVDFDGFAKDFMVLPAINACASVLRGNTAFQMTALWGQ